MKEQNQFTKEEFEKTAVHVSKVSILGNTFLSLLKLLAGIIAHSGAMVSDAVHSASDVFSSIIVIIGLNQSVSPKFRIKELVIFNIRFLISELRQEFKEPLSRREEVIELLLVVFLLRNSALTR